MTQKQVNTGDVIYNEGDVPDYAYIVQSGKIEIVEFKDGKETQIRIVEAGKTFGEFALFDPQILRPFMARVVEPGILLPLSHEEFHKLLLQCPAIIQPFITLCFDKMKSTRVKEKSSVSAVLENAVTKIHVIPASEKLKAQFKQIEVPLERLPFRIGGYPEGGEISRRDQLHLYIAAQSPPLRVSRQHCEINIENGGLWLIDLGSRFCTIVNGHTIGRGHGVYEAPLQKGLNEVTLGAADGPYKITIQCE